MKTLTKAWVVAMGLSAFSFICGGPVAMMFNCSSETVFRLYIGGASSFMALAVAAWIVNAWKMVTG